MSRRCLLALLVLVAATACDRNNDIRGVNAMFLPDPPGSVPSNVAMTSGASAGELITIEVRLTEVDGVYGAAFQLFFDSDIAEFAEWDVGEALEIDGHDPEYTIASRSGTVEVSVTRRGNVSAIDITNSRTLIHLTFRLLSVGQASLVLDAEALFDDQTLPQPLPDIIWSTGVLVGT